MQNQGPAPSGPVVVIVAGGDCCLSHEARQGGGLQAKETSEMLAGFEPADGLLA